MFADDTKVLRCIMSREDSIELQKDVQKLQNWSDKLLLRFNTDKCHVLAVGRTEDIMHTHNCLKKQILELP